MENISLCLPSLGLSNIPFLINLAVTLVKTIFILFKNKHGNNYTINKEDLKGSSKLIESISSKIHHTMNTRL